MTTDQQTRIAHLSTDKESATRFADRLGDVIDPDLCAISIFETLDGWSVEAIFHDDETRAQIAKIAADVVGADAKLGVTSVAERDWIAASLHGLAPVRAGRFVVHGAHDRSRLKPNEIGIEIEAALAFGTGHHGTTRGCLLAFEALRKRDMTGRMWRVLDIGTGTGVLAIAAARALPVPVLASDIDPVAVTVARDNARLNRVPSTVRAFAAAGASAHRFQQGGPYDLIFANILEAPLRRMSAVVAPLLEAGGHIILSGLLPAHANAVIVAYRRQGLILVNRQTLDGWVTLTMRTRGAFSRKTVPTRIDRL